MAPNPLSFQRHGRMAPNQTKCKARRPMVWERIVVVDIATRSGMKNYSGFVI